MTYFLAGIISAALVQTSAIYIHRLLKASKAQARRAAELHTIAEERARLAAVEESLTNGLDAFERADIAASASAVVEQDWSFWMTDRWEFSPYVKAKAKRLVADGSVSQIAPGNYLVQSSAAKPYRVNTDAHTGKVSWISCSCTNGDYVTYGFSKCSHALAVLRYLVDEKEDIKS